MDQPLSLTPEMTAFAARLSATGTVRERTRTLYRALLEDGLDIGYNEDMSAAWRPQGSKTAAAVFEELGADGRHFAMCLEYTLLFVALGRTLGLDVQGFRQDSTLGENRDYIFGHIVAGVFDDGEWHIVDLANRRFYRIPEGFTRISDAALEAYHYNNSGVIFRTQGRLAEAEASISLALDRESQYGPFWYNRGCVRLVSGDAQAAEVDLGRAALLQPGSVHVLTNLAVAQNVQGHRGQALATLYLARTVAPLDARVAYNLGILSYQEGDADTAATHWHDTLAIDPFHAGARKALAQLAQQQAAQAA